MKPARLRTVAWGVLVAALLVTPAKWLLLRGQIQPVDGELAGDGMAIVLVLGASIAAFLILIALMLFTLARRIAIREGHTDGGAR